MLVLITVRQPVQIWKGDGANPWLVVMPHGKTTDAAYADSIGESLCIVRFEKGLTTSSTMRKIAGVGRLPFEA